MDNIIDIKNLTVSYRENVALKNANLSIEERAFVSVIGPNGAGKTTLLTAINGLGKILSGSVKVFGLEITPNLRKKIGYVPQNLTVDPRFPILVKDVVKIGRIGKTNIFRKLTQEDYTVVKSVMELTGIVELADRPIGHLSGGEIQKVALARVLAQEPQIMLLDEPTANLDPKAQAEIINLIDKIYEEQKITIIFATHILNHIPNCCNTAVLMKKGIISWVGKIENVNENLLSELYDYPVNLCKQQKI